MMSKYEGDYTFSVGGCFLWGKISDGTYRAFNNLEEYEIYRDKEEEK